MSHLVRFTGWRNRLRGPGGVAAGAAAAVALAGLVAGISGWLPGSAAGTQAPGPRPATEASPAGSRVADSGAGHEGGASWALLPGGRAVSGARAAARTARTGTGHDEPGRGGARPAGGLRTSCAAVAHIGDSTSVGLISPADLPDPAQRLAAQYREVGVRRVRIDASGGRSMVEELPGQVNGFGAALAMARTRFHGCWVAALGTNDTANVAAGSPVGRLARIREFMSVAGGAPVLWVDVTSRDRSGPWSEANMRLWDDALRQACRQYPTMRIFDWASRARDGWFQPDGIHYTSAGYAARARMIARALARAFPRGGHHTGCVVR